MSSDKNQFLIRLTILTVAFIGGFAIMSVELLGGRILSPYFGSSVYVWGSIITVFMLSLSIGYLSGGKLSIKNPNPLTYSGFFIVAALLLLPVILFAEGIMEQVFLVVEDPRYGSLLASLALYFLPTVVLGMISPYSIRLLVSNQSHSGHVAGQLYFVSTMGSALGTLATSFYFVLWFEVNQILWGIIAVLMTAGLAVMTVNYVPALLLARVQNHEN
ncbi:MAG: fused MFS/spermidine synthase [Pseudohongiellaceae bacterium]